MNGEENINQVPKSNDTSEDANENTSQEQAIHQLQNQSENMEVHNHPHIEKTNFKGILHVVHSSSNAILSQSFYEVAESI